MKNLEPKGVWSSFHSLTQIPRPSGHTKAVQEFLVQYGKSLGLETLQDEIGNVLIRKPASPGMENHPGIILQGHMDMVPQKNSDVKHDFEKDPISAKIDKSGEWVTAEGTTLGADNGIGVAAAMAVLADKNAVHPPLEAFFTVDEETGMYGAFALEGGFLKGKYLLNMDSETEGELCVGCAGGVDTSAVFHYAPVPVEEGDIAVRIDLIGCLGGHSGCDIHLQRANAIKLLFRFLKDAVANFEARLVSVDGGSLRNAIPREASCVITIPAEGRDEMDDLVYEWETRFVKEFDGVESNLEMKMTEVETPKMQMPEDVQDFLIHAITICPDGVYRRIDETPSIVETSNNVAIISTSADAKECKVEVCCLTRSSSESRKEELQQVIHSTFALAGADVSFSGAYPGWQPNFRSKLLQTMRENYQAEFGHEPKVLIMHAGLECGIIARNYPGMEMISFGPTIVHPHTPDERVNIKTVEEFYRFLLASLAKL